MAKVKNPKEVSGSKKVPLAPVSGLVLLEIGVGMYEGARKHGRHNYRDAGGLASTYYNSVFRHIIPWWEGQDDDPDSGLSHVTKAITALVTLRDLMLFDKLIDDRPPPLPPAAFKKLLELLNRQTEVVNARYPVETPSHTRSHIGKRSRSKPKDIWYLSGLVTNGDKEKLQKSFVPFHEAAARLRGEGKEVFNPVEHEKPGWTWEMYLAHFIEWIHEHRPIMYMLRGWKDSQGARLEHRIALLLGLSIIYEEE